MKVYGERQFIPVQRVQTTAVFGSTLRICARDEPM